LLLCGGSVCYCVWVVFVIVWGLYLLLYEGCVCYFGSCVCYCVGAVFVNVWGLCLLVCGICVYYFGGCVCYCHFCFVVRI